MAKKKMEKRVFLPSDEEIDHGTVFEVKDREITWEHFSERVQNGEWLKGVMAVRLTFENRGNFIASGADLLVNEETLAIIGGRWWHNINQTLCTACGNGHKGHENCPGFAYYGRKVWSGRGEVFTPDVSIWKDFYKLQ